MPFSVGDVVAGRYEVQAEIGRRPLGDLYRAREREIGVEVALRVIGAGMLPDDNVRQAFIAKVGRAKSFSHPNLVRVFGVYPTADEVVVAVQWAPGQTLHERIAEKVFTPEQARPLMLQAAAALTHAHQHGVVLGDVHAATVVLLGQTLKLSNVGIGPALPRKRFLEAVRETPGYQTLPPELRSGMTCDTRADVYSLAMLIVEMLTGGTDPAAVTGPEPLKAVLGRALAVDAMVRHTSIDALSHELEAALIGQLPRPRRPTPPVGVAVPGFEKIEEASGPVPKADDVRPPSQETTRAMDADELELLKGDQVTRQVPVDEIFSLRVASSETQQFELDEMIVDDAEAGGEELRLEAPPAHDDLKTEQVVRLEPDAARTTEHPRLPPPVNEDEIDTARVTRADVADLAEKENDPNLTPLPPPVPSSSLLTPPPPPHPGTSSKPPKSPPPSPASPHSDSLVDSKDAPTKVEVREPKIEISVELPIIEVVTAPEPPASSPASPSAGPSSPSSPSSSPPSTLGPAKPDEPLYGSDDDEAPTRTAGPAVPMAPTVTPKTPAPTPAAPSAQSRKKRKNPFEPTQPEEDARTTEHRSPPPRPPKKNPFAPVTADAVSGMPRPAVGAATQAGRKKKPPRPTMLVSPIGKKQGVGPIILVALAAFIAAVGVALAISHHLQEQRLEQERRDKQRLADELNAQAEALKRQQAAARDAGTGPPVSTPIVTHPEPTPTVLPRSGACPLGAHLVSTGGKAFCVDVYEYPGGNTIPRTDVTFAEAGRICAARGERLCTDGEWERACRGKGNASYPYGHVFDPAKCNSKGTGGEVAAAGSFPACRSAAGAYDMTGNVAEWTASGAQRGGSVVQGAKESRCSAAVRNAPESGGVFVGFRCCAEPTGKR